MEIKASSKYDRETITALTHLGIYGKRNPKKSLLFWTISFGILLIALSVETAVIASLGIDLLTELICLIAINAAYILIRFYLHFLVPKIRYKALEKLQNAENVFVFSDDGVTSATQSSAYSDESRISYSTFVKVYEASKYFFLFHTQNQTFVVDKSTIEGGSAEDIRAKLSPLLGKKYMICKY